MRFVKPRYNGPMTQVVLVSFVCFATVGMYSAIGNLGAGGTQNIQLTDITHVLLYGLFAIAGIFSGSIVNIFGPRITLFIGASGYMLYLAGLWVYQTKQVEWFLSQPIIFPLVSTEFAVLAGGILGICAAILWSAQGGIMMSYPKENEKGRAFSIFWVIFNAGSVLGGLIALGIDLSQGAISATANSTYIAFMVVIGLGILLSLLVLPPGRVVRGDNTLVTIHSFAGPREEFRGLITTLRSQVAILLLPMMFASNYFYTYQAAFAVAIFDAETRAVNAVVKAVGQIVGALWIGFMLDKLPMKRRNRGLAGLATTSIFIIVGWSWGLKYQLGFTRHTKLTRLNFKDKGFGEPIAILVWYDVGDAMFQGLAYWIMGAATNDAFLLARYAGLYKAIQSAGAAVAYGVDAAKAPYLSELLSSWLLLLVALVPAGYIVTRIKDTNIIEEGVAYLGQEVIGSEGAAHHLGEKGLHKDNHLQVQAAGDIEMRAEGEGKDGGLDHVEVV